ncbi:hemicentin-1-like [Mizuhopecten yessoensis]|uniref:hemicentin-1-like n=1 Tax=Mizuhopecten yessoensis TaxID=6573 RepID=UPI000B457BF8|nr:hemicentin-1-like [Mizuhopecten yessoensis]
MRTLGIQIPANSYSHRDRWTCEGRNNNFDNTTPPQTDTTTVDVTDPPTNPAIVTGNSDPVYDGDDIELRCSIRGGNPLASLTWTCPGRSVTSTTANTADTAVSVLRIRLTPLYNGANCTCVATHPAQGFMTSHTEVFNVYYAPRIHALTVTDTFPWLARDTYVGRLSCDTTAGNPPTTRYTWYRDGTPVSSQTSQTLPFDPPTSSDGGRLYRCRAENDFTDAKGSAPELDITLDVQYDPIITLSAYPETVNETDNYQCTCIAVGNPNPTVTWYPRDSSTNNILDLPYINRNKVGRYTCNATSSSQKFGSLYTKSDLNLVVQYAPDVELLVQNATEHDTHLVMTCNAAGVPNIYTYGAWTHMYGIILVRTLTGDVTTDGRTLTLASVSYQDSGTYACQVHNSIRGRDGQLIQTETAVFDVKGSPKLLEGGSIDIANKGKPFRKSLIFISNPHPTDMYISKEERLSSTQNLTIIFTTEMVSDIFYGKILSRPGYKMSQTHRLTWSLTR